MGSKPTHVQHVHTATPELDTGLSRFMAYFCAHEAAGPSQPAWSSRWLLPEASGTFRIPDLTPLL